MILCHCAGVSERTITALIREGADSVGKIAQRCGAGRNCASCRETIAAMLSEEAARPAQRRAEQQASAISLSGAA